MVIQVYKVDISARLTVSSVRIWIHHVSVAVDDGVDAGPRPVGREVAPRVLDVVSAVVQHNLPFEHTVRHRAEDCRLRFIWKTESSSHKLWSNLSKQENPINGSICQVQSFCPPYSTRFSKKPL